MLRSLALVWCASFCGFGCATSTVDSTGGTGGTVGTGATGGVGTGGTGGIGTGATGGTPPIPDRILDFSEFETFSLTRSPALGFCPNRDFVANASIQKLSETEYEYQYNTILCGQLEDCSGCVADFPCDFPRNVPPIWCCSQPSPRILESDEIASIKEVFSSIVEVAEADLTDVAPAECGTFDPCLITGVNWDSYSNSDYVCGEPHVSPGSVLAVAAVLSEVAGLAENTCSADRMLDPDYAQDQATVECTRAGSTFFFDVTLAAQPTAPLQIGSNTFDIQVSVEFSLSILERLLGLGTTTIADLRVDVLPMMGVTLPSTVSFENTPLPCDVTVFSREPFSVTLPEGQATWTLDDSMTKRFTLTRVDVTLDDMGFTTDLSTGPGGDCVWPAGRPEVTFNLP